LPERKFGRKRWVFFQKAIRHRLFP